MRIIVLAKGKPCRINTCKQLYSGQAPSASNDNNLNASAARSTRQLRDHTKEDIQNGYKSKRFSQKDFRNTSKGRPASDTTSFGERREQIFLQS